MDTHAQVHATSEMLDECTPSWSQPVFGSPAHASAIRNLEQAEAILEVVEIGGYNCSPAAVKSVMEMVWALVQDARFELTGKPQREEDRPSYLPRRAS